MSVKNLRVSTLLDFETGGSPASPTLGPGNAWEMSFLDKLFTITIDGTAEVDFEGSVDDDNWHVIETKTVSDTFSNQQGYKWVRANLKSWSSGSVVAKVSQSQITGGVSPTINVTAATFYTVGSVAPSSPSDGDVWYDTGTNEYNVYTGGTWYALARENDAVLKDLFDANTILSADSDNTPQALTVAASTIVGRGAAGNIDALTAAETKTILAIQEADISDLQSYLTDITGESISDLSDVAAMTEVIGDMMYFDGTSWNRIARGTSGQVLTMSGSPLLPTWV